MTDILQPTTDGREIAAMLRDRGIEFELRRISLDSIDREASKHNQARFLPLHEETVLSYGAAMEAGDIFPPIIVNSTKGKMLIVLDGNHRIAAADLAGYKDTTAFVVTKISGAAAELLTFEANARHGLPTTVEERVQQGLYLVNLGNRAKEVAQALAIPERRLYTAMGTARGAARLAKVGVKSDGFSDWTIRRLDSLTSNVLLKEVGELAVKARLGADDINTLVIAVNKEGEEKAQLAVVAEERKRHAGRVRTTAGGRLVIPKNIARVTMAYRMVKNLDIEALTKEVGLVDEDTGKALRRELFESISLLVTASEAVGRG